MAKAAINPVVHFEMPYSNPKRASAFYQKAFGWGMQYLPEMGKYILATTSPVNKNQMHLKKGAINGGFYPKSKTYGGTHLVVSVADLKKHIAMVKKAGGKVLGKPMDIQGIGKFIMVKDTEGSKIGMLQPLPMR